MRKLPEGRIEATSIAFPPTNHQRVTSDDGPLRSGALAASDQRLRPDGVPLRSAPATPASRSTVEPLAPARYKVQFTASASLHSKLERLRALVRSQVPGGDIGAII